MDTKTEKCVGFDRVIGIFKCVSFDGAILMIRKPWP